MWRAAAYGDFDTLKRLSDESPGVLHAADPTGYYCLQWAALNNRVAVIAYLLDQGCDINAADTTGQTALHWSAVRGSIPALETLLRSGADLTCADSRGYTVCHVAAQYGQTAVLYHLAMKWGADIDIVDADGRTPLHWAAYKGFADTIRLLLVMGSRPLLTDREGCSPLHWAAIRGNAEACTVLLQGGSEDSLQSPDATGATPSQLAMDKGHRILGLNLAEYRYKRDKAQSKRGIIGMLMKMHLSPVIWSIVLGMLALLATAVLYGPSPPPASHAMHALVWLVVSIAFGGLGFLYATSTADPGFLPQNTVAGIAATRRKSGSVARLTGKSLNSQKDSLDDAMETGDAIVGLTSSSDVNSLNSPALWAGSWNQLCVGCKIVRPLRAKHCSVTDRCIECFDHYCPWVGNAIGKGNRHLFLIFLWLEFAALLISATLAFLRIQSVLSYASLHQSPSGTNIVLLVIFIICDLFLLISVATLSFAQASQVIRNVTTNELANWHRYSYLQTTNGEFVNPFDKGWRQNCYEVCTPSAMPTAPYTLSENV